VIYSSAEFLILFPLFCALYWAAARRYRLVLLLLASVGFYAYGEPLAVPLLIAVVGLAYVAGLAMLRYPDRRGLIALLSVATSVGILGFFKYTAFFGQITGISVPTNILLPLGLSFFTFEAIAYVVDVKRGVTAVERSPLRVALYMALFPHLISGPIMRANQLMPQLRRAVHWNTPTFVSGLQLFVQGFAKKVIVADRAAVVADQVFAAPSDMSTAAAWLGALAYTVQIYGDFAGYTDMGRGIGRMLGLELPLNFDAPYAARSITDFWRRWHISLSSWLRDYLYIGLGGSRKGRARTYLNLMVTMLLGGLWHGAGWTFVAWGGYHGLLLALERRFARLRALPAWVGTVTTLLLVINGWVLFRSRDAAIALAMYQAMYLPRGGEGPSALYSALTLVVFLAVVGAMLLKRVAPNTLRSPWESGLRNGLAYGAVAGLCIVALFATNGQRPFIYFKF
jgi:alginate O-acetyltransferase complex protein AlgI